ncbi:DUF4838 domain-containing protein [Parabacteroides sp. OttesenSCG-928-K15]|nr:DUF4838 domain-containing protein [Parabacteroides sp. OttesenSCG-928-K15]
MKKAILFFLSGILTIAPLAAQVNIVNNGKALGKIHIGKENPVDQQAADLLQDFVGRISGCKLPVVYSGKPQKGDIVIGTTNTTGLTEDGFRLQTTDGVLYISSGGDKGNIYGVVTLLEKYLGVSYYGANEYTLTPQTTITLPEINLAENPAFRYRQSQCYAMREDPIYKLWFRLEEAREVFAGGLWVHTFDRILPSAEYGEAHPEYYSFINGERRPGKASQWCLTNPEVFEIASQKIDSIFKANPGKNLISVSQNDGNFTNCSCPDCKALDEHEGGPSGSLIHFMNKLAARFPDKEFSTLAYLYTMHPPKHVKPLPNVNIMLCDIDCKREVPLTDNASGQDFMKAMKGWAAISNNIFVWDYGINFDNYVAPFPNFPILQKNIQLFKEHNATMHFSQIASTKGGDFAEMRAYMVSKLMWNPYLDTDSLMRSFMDGYYGAASPYIYQYEKLLEGGLLASGVPLWIYDSPVTHKDGMLNANCLKRYNELFDRAEQAVANDEVLLKRVRRSRLPLQYSELEIARAEGGHDLDLIQSKLALFEERTTAYDIPTLNERRNSPKEYCMLYKSRYLPRKEQNLAKGAKIQWINEPARKYKTMGEKALTDELFGGTTFVESWVGWEGVDGAFILDLGKETTITSIESDFLHQLGAWILLPQKVSYSVSSDNITYSRFGEKALEEDRSPQVKFVGVKCESAAPVTTRYIKVEIEGVKTCPSWHYGVGYPAWFFLDEVTVL